MFVEREASMTRIRLYRSTCCIQASLNTYLKANKASQNDISADSSDTELATSEAKLSYQCIPATAALSN